MNGTRLLIALGLCVMSGVVQAADSPAQVGYCIQFLRGTLEIINQPMSSTTPPQGLDAVAATRQQMQAVFDQWRLSGLSLAIAELQVQTEFLRGTAQAKADMTYVTSKTDAQMSDCSKAQAAAPPGTDVFFSCLTEKQKAAEKDPMLEGFRTRSAPCMRGPAL